MLCVASPLPQKYEENRSICLGNGRRCLAEPNHSLLYRRKWCELGQMERLWKTDHLFFHLVFPRGPKTCQIKINKKRAVDPVIWVYLCDACRWGESRAVQRALIDLSEAITMSNELKIGRRRRTLSSVSGITWHQRTFTSQRARPVCEGKTTTSQVRGCVNDSWPHTDTIVNLFQTFLTK